jgi:hypothetical protein
MLYGRWGGRDVTRREKVDVKRIACLAIFFAALLEFAVERARFDLWIMTAAIVPLLWGVVNKTGSPPLASPKPDRDPASRK